MVGVVGSSRFDCRRSFLSLRIDEVDYAIQSLKHFVTELPPMRTMLSRRAFVVRLDPFLLILLSAPYEQT